MQKFCALMVLLFCEVANLYAQELTFYKDVQPIINNKCAPCHRPGESAPFSLLTYEDVKKRASFISDVVSSGYMPPWKADNKYVHYANDRSLTTSEKSIIVKWINNNASAGNPSNKPVAATIVEGTMYSRKPDLVLTAADSFLVKGDGIERFVIFKIPYELPDSSNVEAVEFFSDKKKLVHHANYAVHEVPDTSIDLYKTDPFINLTEDDRKKFDQYQPYRKTITYYGGWIPGSSYESYPKGVGWIMPKRGVILLTVHYAPSAKEETSISGVNFFFSKTPIQRKVKVISFGSGGIGEQQIKPPLLIPPNSVRTYTLDVKNPGEDFSVMYVWPHMHYIGKSFLAYGLTPLGDTIRLTSIPQWDFRWQEIYKFKKFVRIPRGTVVHIEGTFDNTAGNPFNPNSPPQYVFSSGDMRSKDEMLTLLLIFLPYKQGDENISLTEQ